MRLIKEFFICSFKKSRTKYKNDIAGDVGFMLDEGFKDTSNARLLGLFVRAFIVMAITAGTIDGFMSAFNIPYNAGDIYLILAAVNLVLMLTQINRPASLVGYLLCIWGIYAFYSATPDLLSSGIKAVTNLSYELIRIKYKLPAVDGFDEVITDRSYTIPALVITGGILYMIIMWETCGRSINLTFTALISFVVISVGAFFDGIPSKLSLLLLGTAWLASACIKFGGKSTYAFPQKEQYKIYIRKKRHYYHRQFNGRAAAQFTALILLITGLLTGIFDKAITPEAFDSAVPASQLKEFSDFMLKDTMILLFSRYKNYTVKGSVSNGQLGQYSSVHPDHKPDLEITYVPSTVSREYLKTFAGTDYSSDGWTANAGIDDKALSNLTAAAAAKSGLPPHRMRIKSVDITSRTPFLPYYTDLNSSSIIKYRDDTHINADITPGCEYDIKYYDLPQAPIDDSEYRDYAHFLYTGVPDENRSLIESLCIKEGFSADDPDLDNKLAKFFKDNYTYTLDPGLVPWNTDFVNYFLFEHQEGLCAHFASAGTLIYRTLGIPARYVEGYAIDYPLEAKDQIVLESEDINSWYTGGNAITPTPVSIILSDLKAHAWVEIYRDGQGWIPVELTPADPDAMLDEEEEDNTEIGVKLVELIFSDDEVTPSDIIDTSQYRKQAAEVLGYIAFALTMLLPACVLLLAAKIIIRHAKRLYKFSKRDAEAVVEIYTYISDILTFLNKTGSTSFKAAAEALSPYIRSSAIITDTVQQILYAPEPPSVKECENAFIGLHTALEKILAECKLKTRLKILLKL